MRFSKYFGWTATYGTDIQAKIMKDTMNIVPRPVKVNTSDS